MASPSGSLYRDDDDDDDYSARYDSDDFASDDDVVSIRQSSYTSKPTSKKVSASPYTIPNKGAKGRGRGRGSKQTTPQPATNSVAKRMLSASRIRMNGYRNQIEELNIQIRELTEENKTLKKMQFRHQKALGKFEEQESELPLLLTKHANEVRTLREQNRKWKEKYNQTERYLRDAEDELENKKLQLKKYKKLCSQKGLQERDELYRSVQQSEIWLEEKDSRIKELERHIEALNKNHRHEMGIELAHHRETKKQLKLLENKQNDAVLALREKEKELEIKNIYSNRLMKASPKHHSSYNGTPLHTPPPGRKKRVPSLTDLTSRDKVKLYEEKRRIEEKKKSESPRHKPRDIWSEDKVSKEPLKTKQEEKKGHKPIETEDEADLWIQRERNRIQLEKEEQEKNEKEERERQWRKEEKEMKQREEKERRLREEEERESNWREEMEREKRERKRKQEEKEELERQERLDREMREEEERRKREKKEEERKKRLEEEKRQREQEAELREKKAEEERRRLEIDPKIQEERRKKDMLLAKLKQMDNSSEKIPEPVSMKADSPQRATFITSNPAYSPGLDSNYSTKSNYSFTKPTENLHNGLPSHDDVTIPYLEKQRKVKSRKEEEEIGGYQPSFTSSVFNSDNLKAPPTSNKTMISKNNDAHRTTIPASSERKAKLLNDLFGKKTEDTKSNEDFGVGEKLRKSSGSKHSPFPWDNVESKSVNNSAAKRENSSTLFGGGSALIEFDDGFENGATKLLPKRPSHSTTTFSSKPTVNAIDNLDDDIEEVML